MRVEIGAGERPSPEYEVHTDVLPLPGIQVVCHLDRLPFADRSVTAPLAPPRPQAARLVGCWVAD